MPPSLTSPVGAASGSDRSTKAPNDQNTKAAIPSSVFETEKRAHLASFGSTLSSTTVLLTRSTVNAGVEVAVVGSDNNSIMVAWLLASAALLAMAVLLVVWCCRRNAAVRSCCKYCHLMAATRSYNLVLASNSGCPAPRKHQATAGPLHHKNKNCPVAVNVHEYVDGPIIMPDHGLTSNDTENGKFYIIKNGQWPIISEDNASTYSDHLNCSWPVEETPVALIWIVIRAQHTFDCCCYLFKCIQITRWSG